MIEPPGEPRVGGEAEVHHRVLLAGEDVRVEELTGPVREPAQADVGQSRLQLVAVEAQEGRRRGDAVEAVVVVADLQRGHRGEQITR